MATAHLNPDSRGTGGFRLLPQSVPPQSQGFLIATAMQFCIGLTFRTFSDVSFILSATMFSALIAYLLFSHSLKQENASRQIMLQAASFLLAIETAYVLFYFSRHLKG